MGLGVAFFVYVLGAQYLKDGSKKDAQVEGQALPFDVLDIEFELVFDGDRASAADLGQSGQAWFDQEALALSGVPFPGLLHVEGSWAYQRHIALEDVVELGQFVEAGSAEESAYGGQTAVAAGLGGGAEGIDVLSHGAELVKGKGLALKACTLLAKESGRPIEQADKNGDKYCYSKD